jgi:hypothetical protein
MASKKPKPFDIGARVAKKAGGGPRIETIVKTVGRKTWEAKLFYSEVIIETLKTAQLLRPKEPPAEATIRAVIPVLSGRDDEDSDKGSDHHQSHLPALISQLSSPSSQL